jgi:hypothetical protein
MPSIKQRTVEIFLKLKDQLSGSIPKITGSFKKIEAASDKSSQKIESDNKRIKNSFSKVTGIVTKFAGAFSAAFAVSRGIQGFNEFTDRVDRLGKTSNKLGITTQALSRLGYAAELSGVSQEKLALGLQMLARNSAEAAEGTGLAKDAFKALGISAEELVKLSVDQQFKLIANAFEGVANQSQKVSLAMDIFGRSGAELINTMKGGAASLDEFAEASDNVGNTIDQDVANQVQDFNDNMTALQARIDSLGRSLGGPIVEGLNNLFDLFGDSSGQTRIDAANKEIEAFQNRLKSLAAQDNFWDFGKERRAIERSNIVAHIRALVYEIVEIQKGEIKEQTKHISQRKVLDTLASSDKIEAAKIEKQIGERKLKTLEANLKAQESVYQKHLGKVKTFLQSEQDIKKQFDDLSAELLEADTEPEKIEDFTAADVNAIIGQGYIAASDGDNERALELAQKGAEMLRVMRKEGEVNRLMLSGLALDLGEVARQAAAGQTDLALLDADKERIQITKIEDAIKQFKAGVSQDKVLIPINTDEEEFNRQIAALRARVAATPIVIKLKYEGSIENSPIDGIKIAEEVAQRGER